MKISQQGDFFSEKEFENYVKYTLEGNESNKITLKRGNS
jgi:hypothetical protein